MTKLIKSTIRNLFILMVFLFSSVSFAQNTDLLKHKLQTDYPSIKIESIDFIKQLNLYEIKVLGVPNYAYTNKDVDFFIINGELVDPKTKENYSKDLGFVKIKEFFSKLPKDAAITVKFGTGDRKIAIFTDPDCPYCKALDKEIHTNLLNQNLTIYYFLSPLQIIGHEQAPLKAKKILCDSNPSNAWKNWMLNNTLPTNSGDCKASENLTKSMKIAAENGFNSTPIIIFDNGVTSMKQLSANDIKAALNSRKP